MKKLFIILLLLPFFAKAQIDTKPGGSSYQLQSPKNMTSWYNPADSSMWFVHEGKWHKMAGATKKYDIWNHQNITNSGWTNSKILGFDVSGNLVPVSPAEASMVYPASGIAVSTGSAWGTSIPDNSSNWNTVINRKLISDSTAIDGYTRRDRLASQIATREPKFSKNTGFNKNFGSTAGTVLEGRTFGSAANSATTDFAPSSTVSNATHTGDATGSTALTVVKIQGKSFPTLSAVDDQKYPKYDNGTGAFVMTAISSGSMTWPGSAGIPVYSGSNSWGTSITDNSTNWNTAYSNMGKVLVVGNANYSDMSSSQFYSSTNHVYLNYGTLSDGTNVQPARDGAVYTALQEKQDVLVSGTNIKTVGGTSLVGSGDVPFVVPDNSVTVAKLSDYNAPAQGDMLTYNTTYGFVWSAPSSAYTLPLATSTARGGIKIGYTASGANLPVGLASEKAYVTLTEVAINSAYTGTQTAHNHDTHHALLNGSSAQDFNARVLYLPNSCNVNANSGIMKLVNGSSAFTMTLEGVVTAPSSMSISGALTGVTNLTVAGTITGVTTLSASSTITASNFILLSDKRLKQNIKPITFSNANQIKFVQFDMKADTTHRTRYGVIAPDVEKIMPELVHTDKDGMKSVAYIDLLIAKIAELENRIKTLENEK